MVTIRLSRGGAKKRPFYHIVVTDSRNRRDGNYLERLGFFNPVARGKEPELRLDYQRTEYWLKTGAKPSERVAKLIQHAQKNQPQPETTVTQEVATTEAATTPLSHAGDSGAN